MRKGWSWLRRGWAAAWDCWDGSAPAIQLCCCSGRDSGINTLFLLDMTERISPAWGISLTDGESPKALASCSVVPCALGTHDAAISSHYTPFPSAGRGPAALSPNRATPPHLPSWHKEGNLDHFLQPQALLPEFSFWAGFWGRPEKVRAAGRASDGDSTETAYLVGGHAGTWFLEQ